MAHDEQAVEDEIKAKGLTAPRVTPDHVDNCIKAEAFHIFPGTTLTVCCLTLQNGFCVTGESAAASPENFDEALGRKIARARARDRIWTLDDRALLREVLAGEGFGALLAGKAIP
jgi:N4 Gp49/Sf6 Gp66 family protein